MQFWCHVCIDVLRHFSDGGTCLFVCFFSSEMSEWSFISKWYHVISGEITFLNHLPQSDTNKQAPCLCRQL